MDIAVSFWVQALIYAVGLVVIVLGGTIYMPRMYGLSAATGLGLSLVVGAVALCLITMVLMLNTRSDPHMGAIILLLYPGLDIFFAALGLIILAGRGITRLVRRSAAGPAVPKPAAPGGADETLPGPRRSGQ